MLAQENTGKRFVVALEGDQEFPGPGDPDGTGTATLRVNAGQGQVCYTIEVSKIALPATLAHIHVGAAGSSGPPVVDLAKPGEDGRSSGCASVDRDLALAIIRNPENYYVNVHSREFRPGAVRGQLER